MFFLMILTFFVVYLLIRVIILFNNSGKLDNLFSYKVDRAPSEIVHNTTIEII